MTPGRPEAEFISENPQDSEINNQPTNSNYYLERRRFDSKFFSAAANA